MGRVTDIGSHREPPTVRERYGYVCEELPGAVFPKATQLGENVSARYSRRYKLQRSSIN